MKFKSSQIYQYGIYFDRINVWSSIESLGTRFDKVLTGYHYRAIDEAMCMVRGTGGLFNKGWGNPSVPKLIYDEIVSMAQDAKNGRDGSPTLDVTLTSVKTLGSGIRIQEGSFTSPTSTVASSLLPSESREGYFQLVLPREGCIYQGRDTGREGGSNIPVVLLLPGTGESGFQRRRLTVAVPLAEAGIATCILEGPYYGRRRPAGQFGTKLQTVSDLPVLGRATIEESRGLIKWLCSDPRFEGGPKVIAGVSMGGLHSVMTASLLPLEVGCVSWVGPHSGVPVFTMGVMSKMIDWNRLAKDAAEKKMDKWLADIKWGRDAIDEALLPPEPQGSAVVAMQKFLSVTDLSHFPPLKRPDAAIITVAKDDGYIPYSVAKQRWEKFEEDLLASVSINELEGGHVSSILFRRKQFIEAIKQAVEKVRHSPPQKGER